MSSSIRFTFEFGHAHESIYLSHFRHRMFDGVSLEMVKWKQALEQLGHEVLIVAGEDPTGKAQILPELSLH